MRNFSGPALALLGAVLAILFAGPPAAAHAFGARYDLPLPLGLYLVGAGGAVAFSFVIMALAFDERSARARGFWIDLRDSGPARLLAGPGAIALLKAVSAGLFALVLVAGYVGNQDTVRNIAPTFIWIVWWVGFAYVAALAGNFWPVINPWSVVIAGLERASRGLGWRGGLSLDLPYPSWLGVSPAIALFLLFAWFELIADAAKSPADLVTAILIYSGVTWLGMIAFGRDVWLARGEAFSLAFAVFGRFAPIGTRPGGTEDDTPGRWGLRPYGSDLIVTAPCRMSTTVFILVMLSTVTFDGFKETPLWTEIVQSIALTPSLYPLIRLIHDLGFDFHIVLETVVLVLFPLLFLVTYLGFSWLTGRAAGDTRSVPEIAGLFVYSLVPIAIAYHLAHYLSYLLIAGQLTIPLASDPFGLGWNLFGTADYDIDIAIVGARFVWYTAVIAIVVGHVFAVGVAHLTALKVFDSPRAALRSQYPLLVLMVAYTMVSLWILSQPIVGTPRQSALRPGSDTVSLAPFEFRELCLALKPGDGIRIEFRSGQPVDFNIHYHDGLVIRFPVKLANVSVHEGRFVAQKNRSYCLMWLNRNLSKSSLSYRVVGP